ncbi:hypothetical protein KSP40_PGU018934 [Platanthera guangdongensis]|uniref:Uncharacterized protein n=1 Tax=Platanthera guangdongensis TaxID=2320717 RepID=A0ABR2LGX0_9ASPA
MASQMLHAYATSDSEEARDRTATATRHATSGATTSGACFFYLPHRLTTLKMVSDKEWWEATDKKFQAWPRTAAPPDRRW